MRLRIFPRDESFFDLFEAAADNMAESAGCWTTSSKTSSTRS